MSKDINEAEHWGYKLAPLVSSTYENANAKAIQDLSLKVDELTEIVKELYYRQELDRQTAEKDREIQALRMELALNRAGIHLPTNTDEAKAE